MTIASKLVRYAAAGAVCLGMAAAAQTAQAVPVAPKPAATEPAEASPDVDTGGTTVGVGPETEPPT